MTTYLRNGNDIAAMNVFRAAHLPDDPHSLLLVLGDGLKFKGPEWLRTDPAKAILYPVLALAYGARFHIDSMTELVRLDRAMARSSVFRAIAEAYRASEPPGDPVAFLDQLITGRRDAGRLWLRSDKAKGLLFPLLYLGYGHFFVTDHTVEFNRLNQVIPLG